jgi:hypothetical protein
MFYLRGISTGDFEETLAALLGKDAPGLSSSTERPRVPLVAGSTAATRSGLSCG